METFPCDENTVPSCIPTVSLLLPIILKEKHHAFQIKYPQEGLYQTQKCGTQIKPDGVERTLFPKKMTGKHKEAEMLP